jgi:hypothetical protein
MKHPLSAVLVLSLVLAAPGFAASKKSKKPTATPSTLPPTSPMLVVPQADGSSADTSGKIISSEMSGRDLEFFTKAVDAGREQAFYVDLLKKGASSDIIKKLADALTATQNEENMHLTKLAGQKGWTVSLAATPAEKKTGDEIAKLSGSNFDKAAMDKVVTASNVALTAYQNAAQSADPQIKSFAAQMIPLAEEKRHLVEKMTGAGAKAANQLFRHGGTSQTTLAETSAAETPAPETPAPETAAPQAAAAETSEPKATPQPKPTAEPKASPEAKASAEPKATPLAAIKAIAEPRATPLAAIKATSESKATPLAGIKATSGGGAAASEKSAPAGKPAALPTPRPASALPLPVATPPGTSTPAPLLPPIVPSKVPPAPEK